MKTFKPLQALLDSLPEPVWTETQAQAAQVCSSRPCGALLKPLEYVACGGGAAGRSAIACDMTSLSH